MTIGVGSLLVRDRSKQKLEFFKVESISNDKYVGRIVTFPFEVTSMTMSSRTTVFFPHKGSKTESKLTKTTRNSWREVTPHELQHGVKKVYTKRPVVFQHEYETAAVDDF